RAVGEKVEDQRNPDAGTPHTGPAATDLWVDGNAFDQGLHGVTPCHSSDMGLGRLGWQEYRTKIERVAGQVAGQGVAPYPVDLVAPLRRRRTCTGNRGTRHGL